MNVRRLVDAARDGRAPGVTMTVATIAALVWANAAAESYRTFWLHTISVPGLTLSLRDWVDQGLMVAFFVLVGVEIRREMAGGELRSWRHAAVPVGAALGGMAVPALLYAALVHGGAGSRGWGIPMATDVAFALGALALVASHASARLRVFLLTLAVADDIASIVVLILFYSHDIRIWFLVGAISCLAALIVVHTARIDSTTAVIVIAAIAWWALVRAGVEACVIGVAVGLLLAPIGRRERGARRAERRKVRSWERQIEPAVNALVLPVFALANAGVTFAGSGILSDGALTVFVAVVIARVVGKPLGIATTAWALIRGSGHGDQMHLHARDRLGIGALGAVGFTVPLLIVHAALPAGPLVAAATVALLVGSVLGAGVGAIVLRRV